jgi:hypothetical protein
VHVELQPNPFGAPASGPQDVSGSISGSLHTMPQPPQLLLSELSFAQYGLPLYGGLLLIGGLMLHWLPPPVQVDLHT